MSERPHSRIPSLFNLGSRNARGGDDDDASSAGRGLRSHSRSRSRSRGPGNRSRDPSADPHQQQRSSSRGLRPSRSSHALGARSVDLMSERQPRLGHFLADGGPPPPLPGQAFGGGADDLSQPLPAPPPIPGLEPRPRSAGGSRSASQTRGRPESSVGSIPGSRSLTPSGLGPAEWSGSRGTSPEPGRLTKKRTWIPGKTHSRAVSENIAAIPQPTFPSFAFVVGPSGHEPYDTGPLTSGQWVPEIWDETGDLFVYLYDSDSTQPSFRLHSGAVSGSGVFMGRSMLPRGRAPSDARPHTRNGSLTAPPYAAAPGSQPMSRSSSVGSVDSDYRPPTTRMEERADGKHLYLQLPSTRVAGASSSSEGLERLIRVRNLFAFLVGQILVGTPSQPTFFYIFNNIATMLHQYEFSNMDGTSIGEAASSSFLGYVEDLRLNDVRASREKTLEAIVLGEKMKCWPLYNEGYVHAVGKYSELVNLRTPVMSFVSDTTKQRMEKSALSLDQRFKSMRQRLESFEFPALFAGVLNSSATKKLVDVNGWRAGFVAMRKHTLGLYKARYGSWPPKARSKKNEFEGSGLNRIVTQELYQDISDLYDMLVDRTNLTTRSVDGHDVAETSNDPAISVLRKFMSEFDCSSPPVLPPVPYDVPLMPRMEDIRREFADLNLRKQVKERSRKVPENEINMALMASYNRDAIKATPFIQSFMAFERSNARGKTFDEIIDARVGQWIFLYVIIQCLPLLAIDAPDLHWTQGVEYFLCELPKGSPPWQRDDASNKKFYAISGGTGVVSLPADVVDHGVEGTYFRSHCWQVASQWNTSIGVTAQHYNGGPGQPDTEIPWSPSEFAPPPVLGGGGGGPPGSGSRPGSRVGSRPGSAAGMRQSTMQLGLEALPAPPSLVDPATTRRLSMTPDPNRNFDAILGSAASAPTGKKKK